MARQDLTALEAGEPGILPASKALRIDEEGFQHGTPGAIVWVCESGEELACLMQGNDGWHVHSVDDGDA